jgi:hypothetical protein
MIVLETDAIVPLAHLRPILIHQILAVFLGKDELGHGDCCSKIAARALDSGRIF